MAMQALTVRGIEALKPQAKRYEVFDALTPGLAIRVTPSGHKSWVLFYRHHARLRRLTLGRYPDRPLAEARSESRQNVYEFKARARRTAGRALEQVGCAPPHSA